MQKITISYEEYLTEKKLINLFEQIKDKCDLTIDIHTNYKIDRYRGDLVVDTKKRKFLIEFDGYRHYTEGSVQARDQLKDAVWKLSQKDDYSIVRIPYFVQLDSKTFKYYFEKLLDELDLEVEVSCNYKHGFIDKKAALPCDFCSIGERKFIYDLATLPKDVVNDIIQSLITKVKEKKDSLAVLSINLRQFKVFEDFDYLVNDIHIQPYAVF